MFPIESRKNGHFRLFGMTPRTDVLRFHHEGLGESRNVSLPEIEVLILLQVVVFVW